MNRVLPFSWAALLLVTPVGMPAPPAKLSPEAVEFFEERVRPIFVENCQTCHGPKRQQAGLRLDSRETLLKGSDDGPVIEAGMPDRSKLIQAIRYTGDTKMPPRNKLSAAAIADLTRWVEMGAPWPESGVTTTTSGPMTVAEARRTHWSFRPVSSPTPPAVRNAAWEANAIDRFILAKLEAAGLAPSPDADRATLIRRVTLDLTGLPPTPEEIDAFCNDGSPDAWDKVVDRLLASPSYGERWGRHWLDVARYADTKGYVFQEERRYPFAYTYRDYVIRAFNSDLPYDQFILHQLAADRLELGTDKTPLAAMGFLTLGRRFLNSQPDIIDDRIDVTMRGLQGLSVGCARCHDHKFDPIPQKDYYSLYGVFASSIEPKDLPVLGSAKEAEAFKAFSAELEKLQKAVDEYKTKFAKELAARNRKNRDELKALEKKVDALKASHPGAPPSAMVLVDMPQPVQPVVFLRGNPGNRGPSVPRQFPEVVAGAERKPFTSGSGRLEMAKGIASGDNPLTARVMVNRVWMHHFGQGLVRTPSDFGFRGEAPTHPELLDYLAKQLVDDGWSIKKLHRSILLSRTYRQGSDDREDGRRIDVDNRLLWKMNRQRLDFEAMRDSFLAVAGRLDRAAGGVSVQIANAPFSPRRSVYGFIDRQNLPGVFRTFDLASPDAHTPQRHKTTVPQQALFLMNSPFALEQARALTERSDVAGLTKPAEKITRLYQIMFGRTPDADEIAAGLSFVDAAGKQSFTDLTPWQQYAQVLLLSNEFAFVD